MLRGFGSAALLGLCACGARSPLDADGGSGAAPPSGSSPTLEPTSCAYGGQPNAPWPMLDRCPDHRSFIPVALPSTSHIRWRHPGGGQLITPPVVAADGTIYVGSPTGELLAISSRGSLKWSRSVGGLFHQAAAIGSNGVVYVVSQEQQSGSGVAVLSAVSPAGEIEWAFVLTPTSGTSADFSPPTIGPEGNIYVSGGMGLSAVSPNGALLWAFASDGYGSDRAPAVGADGTIYYAPVKARAQSPTFVAVDATGHEKWSLDTGFVEVGGGPSLSPGGTLYGCGQAGGQADEIYAVGSGGALAWMQTLDADGWGCTTAPAIGSDGRVLFALNDQVAAVAPGGASDWTINLVTPSLAIGNDTVIVTAADGIHAFAANGSPLWSIPLDNVLGPAAIGADGTVYVASLDGGLLAIGPE
jgi:outer membrane protein assembly factor BamB